MKVSFTCVGNDFVGTFSVIATISDDNSVGGPEGVLTAEVTINLTVRGINTAPICTNPVELSAIFKVDTYFELFLGTVTDVDPNDTFTPGLIVGGTLPPGTCRTIVTLNENYYMKLDCENSEIIEPNISFTLNLQDSNSVNDVNGGKACQLGSFSIEMKPTNHPPYYDPSYTWDPIIYIKNC